MGSARGRGDRAGRGLDKPALISPTTKAHLFEEAMPSVIPLFGSGATGTEDDAVTFELDRGVDLEVDLVACRYVGDARAAVARVLNVHKVCVRLADMDKRGEPGCLEDSMPVSILGRKTVQIVLLKAPPGLYVMDSLNSCIITWELRPYLGSVVAGGMDRWENPRSMFVDESGSFYVSESGKHRVTRWDPDAECTTVAGSDSSGSSLDQLDTPCGIFVNGEGDLYVAEVQNDRVTRWRLHAALGEVVLGGFGRGDGLHQLSSPQGVWLDSSGTVLLRTQVGSTLSAPTAVLVGSDGMIYVVDCRCRRVSRWQPGSQIGELVAGSWAKNRRRETRLAMHVDPAGVVHITDLNKLSRDASMSTAWCRGEILHGVDAAAAHPVYEVALDAALSKVHHIVGTVGVLDDAMAVEAHLHGIGAGIAQVMEFVRKAVDGGGNVLIHCFAGAHRAGTTGVAFLMHAEEGLGAKSALAAAQRLRPVIDPKAYSGLWSLLLRLEQALSNK
eukprot:CAMPEP_0177203948 /NCGR_PEP_ID=MMETSP0367-20130122/28085_1 /TAXON_ID=447022 ORGANISM="Scrippsiella hangoei-like, Strain SHHI-4" /NCGR_SAMPLE_ID=MMETSP0367 /ASSEMBLY_ACC=CAM_ASM_000362 /LENGTH=499 /DNA_ID=CAMNT_0018652609 /DNA_START=55 /DNA_END=1557 /DNA_ORIENTATION=-